MRERGGRREGGRPPPSRSSKSRPGGGRAPDPSESAGLRGGGGGGCRTGEKGRSWRGHQLHPAPVGLLPAAAHLPHGKFPGREIAISFIPIPSQPPSLLTENLLSPFPHPSHPTLLLLPYSGGKGRGLDTCGSVGRRGIDVGASSSSPTPRVGIRPRGPPFNGLSPRRAGVPHSLFHSLPLAGILRFERLLRKV